MQPKWWKVLKQKILILSTCSAMAGKPFLIISKNIRRTASELLTDDQRSGKFSNDLIAVRNCCFVNGFSKNRSAPFSSATSLAEASNPVIIIIFTDGYFFFR